MPFGIIRIRYPFVLMFSQNMRCLFVGTTLSQRNIEITKASEATDGRQIKKESLQGFSFFCTRFSQKPYQSTLCPREHIAQAQNTRQKPHKSSQTAKSTQRKHITTTHFRQTNTTKPTPANKDCDSDKRNRSL